MRKKESSERVPAEAGIAELEGWRSGVDPSGVAGSVAAVVAAVAVVTVVAAVAVVTVVYGAVAEPVVGIAGIGFVIGMRSVDRSAVRWGTAAAQHHVAAMGPRIAAVGCKGAGPCFLVPVAHPLAHPARCSPPWDHWWGPLMTSAHRDACPSRGGTASQLGTAAMAAVGVAGDAARVVCAASVVGGEGGGRDVASVVGDAARVVSAGGAVVGTVGAACAVGSAVGVDQ
jgi:hypothetical protein